MADIQKLLKSLLDDPKFATGRNFASKVYQDEPILITGTQMERFTPPKYRAMRKIARDNGNYHESEAKIFYEQGKFMEDFEDDYDYQGDFVRYFPTYQAMNDSQLRGYFSWRTRARRGLIEKTSLSFAFVYIYELLNQIGPGSPAEGFQALKNFWLAYKEIDPQIDRYVKMWLRDYVVYHNLDRSLLEDISHADFDKAVLILLNHKSHGDEEVFAALNSLSPYDLANSRFYKQHPDDVKSVTCKVFAAFSDHYGKNCKSSLCENFFGKMYSGSYFMFNSAVFYSQSSPPDFRYEINDIYKFACKNGSWSCERFFRYGDKSQQIGALLKTIDFLMRRKYNFKSTLKPGKATKILAGIINQAIDDFREKQRQSSRPRIEIDVSKLQNIRDAALETQSKLIIEDAADETDAPALSAEKPVPGSPIKLSEAEYRFMSGLLYGKSYAELVNSKGLMLSVLIDTINEKLFGSFGDTVIIETGGQPELVEDYIAELKEMIQE